MEEVVVLKLNPKTGKYEGKGAIPFRNEEAFASRGLSDSIAGEQTETDYRRLTVTFRSGHRFVVDLERSFFLHQGVDLDDASAARNPVDTKLSDSEMFRRGIRDFSRQIPIVYERWSMSDPEQLRIAAHSNPTLPARAADQRIVPLELLGDFKS